MTALRRTPAGPEGAPVRRQTMAHVLFGADSNDSPSCQRDGPQSKLCGPSLF